MYSPKSMPTSPALAPRPPLTIVPNNYGNVGPNNPGGGSKKKNNTNHGGGDAENNVNIDALVSELRALEKENASLQQLVVTQKALISGFCKLTLHHK